MKKVFFSLFTLLFFVLISSCSEGAPSGSYDPTEDHNTFVRFQNQPGGSSGFVNVVRARALIQDVKLVMPNQYERLIYQGPFVFNFDFSGIKQFVGSNICDTGAVTTLKFTIHKCAEYENFTQEGFKDGPNPNQRFSFVFDYIRTDINNDTLRFKYLDDIQVSIPLTPSINITKGSKFNITMAYNHKQWFRDGTTTYFDPTIATNYGKIEQSIQASIINAFKDDNP